MLPVNMLSDINMDLFQAFNPLYAVPIVAVIVCAVLVYAFGFKSPIPPPSFEGIEEEKKYPKKRRVKENIKKEKLLQNGKVSGTAKTNTASSKKKETVDKQVAVEKSAAVVEKSNVAVKSNVTVKTPVVDKKANKKARLQNEKKSAQEKNDVISHDDFNEDGWVRLAKKEKRVKKPKVEIRYVPSVLSYDADANKSEDNSKTIDEISKDISAADKKQSPAADKKQSPATDKKQSPATDDKQASAADKKQTPAADKKQKKKEAEVKSDAIKVTPTVNADKAAVPMKIIEDPLPDNADLDKPLKDIATDSPKVAEEGKKPKKKKKKNKEAVQPEKDSTSEPENVSDMSAAQVIYDIPAPQEIIKPVVVEDLSTVDKVEKDQPSEVKNSNVAFDELAGLYPEAKQQKKKKKVRRDH